MTSPACPACGATHAVPGQRISGRFLRAMWRWQFGYSPPAIDTTTQYQCDCGLRFFHPAQAGDATFYQRVYAAPVLRKWMQADPRDHADFVAAAAHLHAGDRVLDVGGHGGAFARLMPAGAQCTVIDPHADGYPEADGVLAETAAEHAARHPEHYDAVCAFQVIEHVEQPRALAADMLAALRPGGLLILAGPSWPSMLTEIPNMALNAPPNHLTWWSPQAFRRFAESFGLEVIEARTLEATEAHRRILYWLWKLTPLPPPDRAYAHDAWWYATMAFAAVCRGPLNAILGPGKPGPGTDAFLVARKPARTATLAKQD
jgi:2-polyprenyl-3-methyl-5-hydroxy-6-metoxy-1,4-benzoquinol methylase